MGPFFLLDNYSSLRISYMLVACQLVVCGGLVTVRQAKPESSGTLLHTTNRKFPCIRISTSAKSSMAQLVKSVVEIRNCLTKSNQGLERGLHDIMNRQFACCCEKFPPFLGNNIPNPDGCGCEDNPNWDSLLAWGFGHYKELHKYVTTWNDIYQLNKDNLVIWEKIKEVFAMTGDTGGATTKCILLREHHTHFMSRVAKSVISVNRTQDQACSFISTTKLSQLIVERRKEIGRDIFSLKCKKFDGDELELFPILVEETFYNKLKESSQVSSARKLKLMRSNCETALRSINHYFEKTNFESSECGHLIICVHGLGGSHLDLKLYKLFLKLYLPDENLDFLMTNIGEQDYTEEEIRRGTFDKLAKLLITEIANFIKEKASPPKKISFIGFSIGGLIIRAALKMPEFDLYLPKLNVFLTIGCPHLGMLYMRNRLLTFGARLLYRNEPTVKELLLSDKESPLESYLMKLSKNSRLEYFKYIILCGSPEDGLVPHHSANLFLCNEAVRDSTLRGIAYKAMVDNLHSCMFRDPTSCKVLRYTVWFGHGYALNPLNAKVAHVSLVDNVSFIEKFIATIHKYFN